MNGNNVQAIHDILYFDPIKMLEISYCGTFFYIQEIIAK